MAAIINKFEVILAELRVFPEFPMRNEHRSREILTAHYKAEEFFVLVPIPLVTAIVLSCARYFYVTGNCIFALGRNRR